jgi:cytochrome c-type biogenesis protein CcmE
MSHKAVKVGITGAVIAAAFAALLFTSVSENLQYYKYVDEVVAEQHAWEGKAMKIHGYVLAGSISRNRATREYRFQVQRNGKVIPAVYTGSPPDAFKDDAEVVLTGKLDKHGFHATDISAKCPSKYEEGAGKGPGKIAALPGDSGQ